MHLPDSTGVVADRTPRTAAAELDPRIRLNTGVAEALPFAAGSIDLIVGMTSFDHWLDQRRGLGECARVLSPDAPLVLCDLFSAARCPRRGSPTGARFVSAKDRLPEG